MTKFQEKARIVTREELWPGVVRLRLQAPQIASQAQPGQFVMVRVADTFDPLLRRPFSILSADERGKIELLLKVVGRGTGILAQARAGDVVDCLGPLGQGFPRHIEDTICLVGGGMGVAPLFFLAEKLISEGQPGSRILSLLGGRNRVEIQPLAGMFAELGCTVLVATDDGSLGRQGFVHELLPQAVTDSKGMAVRCCGPWPMMRMVAGFCQRAGLPCLVSLEAQMACGLGVCLGCTVRGSDGAFLHVCQHGPVFDAERIAWTK